MMYLKELGFEETVIESLLEELPSGAVEKLTEHQETITTNINYLKFKIGQSYNLDEVKQKLVNLGYVRCELIEGRGQFSVRGGIVDVSINDKTGIRIEFWGDEVDSIRNFSISSQRSIDTKETATIYPAHEYILEKSIEDICKSIKERLCLVKEQGLSFLKIFDFNF